jgi:hypothetical protein
MGGRRCDWTDVDVDVDVDVDLNMDERLSAGKCWQVGGMDKLRKAGVSSSGPRGEAGTQMKGPPPAHSSQRRQRQG